MRIAEPGKQKWRPILSDKDFFFLLLMLIGYGLAVVYYFLISGSPLFDIFVNRVHHYEYYTKSLILYDSLKGLDLAGFYKAFISYSYVDRFAYLRAIPFYFMFSPTKFMFFYSNFILNYVLLIWLYHALLKIFDAAKSFLLTLSMLSCYLIAEYMASSYMDLTLCIACAIFFIYLYLFTKDTRKHNVALALLVMFLLLIKYSSYLILPLVWAAAAAYFFMTTKKPWGPVVRMAQIFFSGFLIYFIIFTACSPGEVLRDLRIGREIVVPGSFAPGALPEMVSGIFGSANFLSIFPLFAINLLLYLSVSYRLVRKKDLFSMIFISSIIYAFIIFNVLRDDNNRRQMMPFYFIYILLLFELFDTALKAISKRHYLIMSLIISSMVVFNLFCIYDPDKSYLQKWDFPKTNAKQENIYDIYNPEGDAQFSSMSEVLASVPIGTRVYAAEENIHEQLRCRIVDSTRKYSHLPYDPRFRYTIVDRPEEADYIISDHPVSIKNYSGLGQLQTVRWESKGAAKEGAWYVVKVALS